MALAALALSGAATLSLAQIRSMNLEEMVEVADGAIHGTIVNARVFRVDHPADGSELYFTTLTIEGRAVGTGDLTTVEVTFNGGFLSDTEGVFNSEAPSKDDIRIGTPVVAFYSWMDDMGGGVAGNALEAMHGGLYRTIGAGESEVVLGRGQGYAVSSNVRVNDLSGAVHRLHQAKIARQQGGK